jgi:hypothetical protein
MSKQLPAFSEIIDGSRIRFFCGSGGHDLVKVRNLTAK